MSLLQVNACQHITVQDIVTCVFPAIMATNNKPTPAITSMTIGYIHALVMDTLTFNSTEAPYARALVNQAVIVGELDKLTPAAFQTELRNCLVDYYENVCLMVGACGALSIPTHKRKFKPTSAGVEEAAGAGAGASAGDTGAGDADADADIEAYADADIEAATDSMSQASARAAPAAAPAAAPKPAAPAAAPAAAPKPAAPAAAPKPAAAEATPSPAKGPRTGGGSLGGAGGGQGGARVPV